MPRPSLLPRWIRISRVRGAALAALVAASVGLPIALTTLDLTAEPRPPRLGPVATSAPPPDADARRRAAVDPEVQARRARAGLLLAMSTPELSAVVRDGQDPIERMAGLQVLWNRGERAQAERLVAEARSRELDAKLSALRARTK